MHKLILAAVSIAALSLAGPASAQAPIVIKFSHVVATNTPKNSRNWPRNTPAARSR
jgi:C4-dicarboxylate-binding protein DctP